MTRSILILAVVFLLPAAMLQSQNAWEWQNPLPQGSTLSDIVVVDSLHGWSVGGAGAVLRTTNGGKQWTPSRTPIHEFLSCASFLNPTRGWVMTRTTGKILKTTDGGLAWDSISTLPSPNYFYDLSFVNDSLGFASGSSGLIVRTTDGGHSWIPSQMNTYGDLVALCFANDRVGWVTGTAGSAFKTTDSGVSWTSMSMYGTLPSIRGMFCLDEQHVFAVGSISLTDTSAFGLLMGSINGGASWQTMGSFREILSEVYFFSPDSGWVTDIGGNVHRTTDGGHTWELLEGRAEHFAFAGSKRAWGIDGRSGLISATEDGWYTAHLQSRAVTTSTLWAVSAFDSLHAAACGVNALVVGTKDGGRSWIQYHAPGDSVYLMDILHKSASEIWAVGEQGRIVHTTDGGATWSDSTISSARWLSGIAFASPDTGYIVSAFDGLFSTHDAGKTWVWQTSITSGALERIRFASRTLGWIVADDGVYRSIDAGVSWQQVHAATGAPLDLAAVGNRAWYPQVNRVAFTTDLGSTWTSRQVFPVDNIIYDIRTLAFTDEMNGWAASWSGRIYRTTDGGESWNMESDLSGNALWGISFAGRSDGWAVGHAGAILHYSNRTAGVALRGQGRWPTSILLDQNYPNPFNSTTTIRYALPHRSHVALDIFNTLGQQVATLMDQDMEPGFHEVRFDAGDLASGVYFYRMRAGGFVQTRKLCFVR